MHWNKEYTWYGIYRKGLWKCIKNRTWGKRFWNQATEVGDYIADLFIVDKIIIELKNVNEITGIHKAQLLNYLKATGIKLGILVNFSRERNTVDVERISNLI